MESTLSATTSTMTLLSLTKTINSNSSSSRLISQLHRRFSTAARAAELRHLSLNRIILNAPHRNQNRFGSVYLPRSLAAVELYPARRNRLGCASFASGGGGFGGNDGSSCGGGGGGGGDSAAEGGETKPAAVAGGADDVSALSSEVIILDVGGMTCGGCVASVKRILESQPQVSSASVNLTTETAVVWPVTEAKDVPNWRTQLGEALAKHLTNCGFQSNLRGQGAIEGDVSS